jgi:hypothetical protein
VRAGGSAAGVVEGVEVGLRVIIAGSWLPLQDGEKRPPPQYLAGILKNR